jgi:hypothetical protein
MFNKKSWKTKQRESNRYLQAISKEEFQKLDFIIKNHEDCK